MDRLCRCELVLPGDFNLAVIPSQHKNSPIPSFRIERLMLRKETRDRLRRLNGHRNRKTATGETPAIKPAQEGLLETPQAPPPLAHTPSTDASSSLPLGPTAPVTVKSNPPSSTTTSQVSNGIDANQLRLSLQNQRLRQQLANHPVAPSPCTQPAVATTGELIEIPIPETSLLENRIPITTGAGKHLLIQRPLSELWPGAHHTITLFTQRQAMADTATGARVAPHHSPPSPDDRSGKKLTTAQQTQRRDYAVFQKNFPENCVFLDLETCGLAGSAIFLAGLLHHPENDPSGWTISQFWARNPAEERAMLESVKSCIAEQQVLLTFNGKSFDWPQLRDRCTLHARSADCGLPEPVHLDLLHLSRQRWKKRLPDCRLQTLERFLCHRYRTDDIPGRDIPAAYDAYVQSGVTDAMDRVLHHNALDLVTLFELALRWDVPTIQGDSVSFE